MNKNYLEDARKKLLNYDSREYGFYEGMSSSALHGFLRLLGNIVPNKVTPEELILYVELLVDDIRKRECKFNNSVGFKKYFKEFVSDNEYDVSYASNIDVWLTWFPEFIKIISDEKFFKGFNDLFRSAFYENDLNYEEEQDYGCIEVEKDYIDISNKNKADVLAALYNAAKPMGMGVIHYDPTPMTRELAEYALEHIGTCFGYLKGRVMHVNLEENVIYVGAYNRDNGQDDLAQRVISTCPNVRKRVKI